MRKRRPLLVLWLALRAAQPRHSGVVWRERFSDPRAQSPLASAATIHAACPPTSALRSIGHRLTNPSLQCWSQSSSKISSSSVATFLGKQPYRHPPDVTASVQPLRPHPSKSDQIRPNPASSNRRPFDLIESPNPSHRQNRPAQPNTPLGVRSNHARPPLRDVGLGVNPSRSNQIQVNPTKSRWIKLATRRGPGPAHRGSAQPAHHHRSHYTLSLNGHLPPHRLDRAPPVSGPG